MRGMTAVVCLLFVLVPRVVAAQASVGEQAPRTPDDNRPRRLSVHLIVPLGPHLRVSGDVGFLLFVGERDVIGLILPLRAGLAWPF